MFAVHNVCADLYLKTASPFAHAHFGPLMLAFRSPQCLWARTYLPTHCLELKGYSISVELIDPRDPHIERSSRGATGLHIFHGVGPSGCVLPRAELEEVAAQVSIHTVPVEECSPQELLDRMASLDRLPWRQCKEGLVVCFDGVPTKVKSTSYKYFSKIKRPDPNAFRSSCIAWLRNEKKASTTTAPPTVPMTVLTIVTDEFVKIAERKMLSNTRNIEKIELLVSCLDLLCITCHWTCAVPRTRV